MIPNEILLEHLEVAAKMISRKRYYEGQLFRRHSLELEDFINMGYIWLVEKGLEKIDPNHVRSKCYHAIIDALNKHYKTRRRPFEPSIAYMTITTGLPQLMAGRYNPEEDRLERKEIVGHILSNPELSDIESKVLGLKGFNHASYVSIAKTLGLPQPHHAQYIYKKALVKTMQFCKDTDIID